ncbi:oligosaccharide flippase family protein [uncultured Roseobacter sp.]|uniref:oligosaccharide flippase family protein n=1 Tax=uncultured Roseobacter sp. TaxID=114847 RepID=UPI002615B4D0|nr:oligosaccharide flippase family protein [uncultured Roseobacter sp.]
MKRLVQSLISGGDLKSRSLRGTMLTMLSFGGTNALRLASNLILTRILFPEAFGMMALVQVFITGLRMFSDTGIRTSIMQNPRGDDPDFLNTAWTLQIIRGVILWLLTCAIALPVANLYDEPMLAQLLPVVGLGTLIAGFTTTNVATAGRHMHLGRTTAIDLGTQAFGVVAMVLLALWLESVWALVFGSLIGSVVTVIVQGLVMPGIRNRLRWDRSAVSDLFHFGKFIFLSTAVTFMISQGDKAILGGYISLAELGVYNIGYFLGSLPLVLMGVINGRIVFPLYRLKPIAESPENRAKVFKARRMVMAGGLLLTAVFGYGGIALIDLMYDDRYALAGPVVVLLSLTMVPQLVIKTYGAVLLAAGDSKNFFTLNCSTAVLQTVLMFAGATWFGIFGVMLAPPIAILLTNPLRIYYVRKYNAWDAKADGFFMTTGFIVNGLACWLHWDEIIKLMG